MAIVYEHLRNDTNEVFYVGMGRFEKRAYSKEHRNKFWNHIVSKHVYTINIIHKECILMFLNKPMFLHRFHGTLKKLSGNFPK